jgi:hypothetical protein
MFNPLNWFKRNKYADLPVNMLEGRLRGQFMVKGGLVKGWVSTQLLAPKGNVEVKFVRRGKVVAQCTAELHKERKRFEFQTDVGPWYDEADLLDDGLIVWAFTKEGATGTLSPHGQTQLSAIRAHLTGNMETAIDLTFGRNGNVQPFLGAGWAQPEPMAHWTSGKESVITLDRPEAPGTYTLRVTAGGFVNPPDLPRQEAEVLVNGAYVSNFVLEMMGDQHLETRIAGDVMAAAPKTTILFRHLHAASPSDFGKPDKRLLAMRVRRLMLVRLDGAR